MYIFFIILHIFFPPPYVLNFTLRLHMCVHSLLTSRTRQNFILNVFEIVGKKCIPSPLILPLIILFAQIEEHEPRSVRIQELPEDDDPQPGTSKDEDISELTEPSK